MESTHYVNTFATRYSFFFFESLQTNVIHSPLINNISCAERNIRSVCEATSVLRHLYSHINKNTQIRGTRMFNQRVVLFYNKCLLFILLDQPDLTENLLHCGLKPTACSTFE
jgi:hypothetical protein